MIIPIFLKWVWKYQFRFTDMCKASFHPCFVNSYRELYSLLHRAGRSTPETDTNQAEWSSLHKSTTIKCQILPSGGSYRKPLLPEVTQRPALLPERIPKQNMVHLWGKEVTRHTYHNPIELHTTHTQRIFCNSSKSNFIWTCTELAFTPTVDQ